MDLPPRKPKPVDLPPRRGLSVVDSSAQRYGSGKCHKCGSPSIGGVCQSYTCGCPEGFERIHVNQILPSMESIERHIKTMKPGTILDKTWPSVTSKGYIQFTVYSPLDGVKKEEPKPEYIVPKNPPKKPAMPKPTNILRPQQRDLF